MAYSKKTRHPFLFLSLLAFCKGLLLFALPASAQTAPNGQILPDNSLGAESSVLSPNEMIRGALGDRIEGGAVRGNNLFHSFQDFNINLDQRVYFSNPGTIENILTRVTGQNYSDINGTLGVDGAANLYLINPNGIIFGPNAMLDVAGSFTASTADRFTLGDGITFRAINPNAPPLVTINIPIGIQLGEDAPAALVSDADLAVGQDLSLSGGTVASRGILSAPAGLVRVEGSTGDVQVQAVTARSAELSAQGDLVLEESRLQTTGDLSLASAQTVRVRDSEESAFRAIAGGNLTIQGNQNVDILALNHPATPFQSGRNTTLISNGDISADSHFFSVGNFSLENLEGASGNFVSFEDPIISANGDVSFGDYEGVALKIEATGSIFGNNISITGTDNNLDFTTTTDLEPDDMQAVSAENDLSRLETSSSVILRAGLSSLLNQPTGANNLVCQGTDCDAGFTQRDTGLPVGTIQVNSINTLPDRGPVIIESQSGGNVDIDGIIPETTISILASSVAIDTQGNVNILGGTSVTRDGEAAAGDINIGGQIVPENVTAGRFSSRNVGTGDGGNVDITARGILTITGGFNRDSGTGTGTDSTLKFDAELHEGYAGIATQANGDGGNITIAADGGIIIPAEIVSVSENTGSGKATGAGGAILLQAANGSIGSAEEDRRLGNVSSFGEAGGGIVCIRAGISGGDCGTSEGTPTGGTLSFAPEGTAAILLNAVRSSVTDLTRTERAGNILIEARDQVMTGSTEATSGDGDGADTSGDIDIISRIGGIVVGGDISSSTMSGDAGDIRLRAREEILIDASEETSPRKLSSSSEIAPDVSNGSSDTVRIQSDEQVTLRNVDINSETSGREDFSNLGNIEIEAPIIEISNNSEIRADSFNFEDSLSDDNPDTLDQGRNAGSILIGTQIYDAGQITQITISNSEIGTDTHGNHGQNQRPGNAGDITIGSGSTNTIQISGADTEIRAETHSHLISGRNSDSEDSTYSDYSELSAIDFESGNGGDIKIEGQSLTISDATINTTTFGTGSGGDITLNGQEVDIINSARVVAETSGATTTATGGDIRIGTLNGNSTINIANSVISTTTGDTQLSPDNPAEPNNIQPGTGLNPEFGLSDAGDIEIGNSTTMSLGLVNSDISAIATQPSGGSGNIAISTQNLNAENTSISTSNIDDPNGGNITFQNVQQLAANSSLITTSTRSGVAGNISINQGQPASQSITLSGATSSPSLLPDQAGGDRFGIIAAATQPNGQAGNVSLAAQTLIVEQGAQIEVSSPEGQAGNINISSANLILDNGKLLAETGAGTGANIRLTSTDLFLMRNDSLISARARGNANGGNIQIDTLFATVIDSEPFGNDIIAIAELGNGGSITINAENLIGFQERSSVNRDGDRLSNSTSDLDASSRQGNSGIVNVSILNIEEEEDENESETSNELPLIVGETSQAFKNQFSAQCNDDDDQRSRLTVAGRGGVPAHPSAPLQPTFPDADWVTLNPQLTPENDASASEAKEPESNEPESITALDLRACSPEQ